MSIEIKKITNANVYVDGNSLLGKVAECTLPEVKIKLEAHAALGMEGVLELPAGVEKMEATFKWNALYADILGKVADPYKACEVQVRGSMETYGNSGRTAEVPVIAYLTGTFSKFPLGAYKQNTAVEAETTMNCTFCKLEVEGTPVLEFDAFANIYKANGTDLLATYKANIGM